jgi:hypothetical protein
MIDWNAARDMYLSGEPAHRVAKHFGITQRQLALRAKKDGFRRVDVGQRKARNTTDDVTTLAKAAMRAAAKAAVQGDSRAMELAARAAERVLKAAVMIAQLEPQPPAEAPREAREQAISRRFEIYEAQRRYDAGCREEGSMPLWQRYDRPDKRKPGEMPIVYWWRGGRGPEPVKPSPEEALYDMECRWIRDGLITGHSEDTAAFRAGMAQGQLETADHQKDQAQI